MPNTSKIKFAFKARLVNPATGKGVNVNADTQKAFDAEKASWVAKGYTQEA